MNWKTLPFQDKAARQTGRNELARTASNHHVVATEVHGATGAALFYSARWRDGVTKGIDCISGNIDAQHQSGLKREGPRVLSIRSQVCECWAVAGILHSKPHAGSPRPVSFARYRPFFVAVVVTGPSSLVTGIMDVGSQRGDGCFRECVCVCVIILLSVMCVLECMLVC